MGAEKVGRRRRKERKHSQYLYESGQKTMSPTHSGATKGSVLAGLGVGGAVPLSLNRAWGSIPSGCYSVQAGGLLCRFTGQVAARTAVLVDVRGQRSIPRWRCQQHTPLSPTLARSIIGSCTLAFNHTRPLVFSVPGRRMSQNSVDVKEASRPERVSFGLCCRIAERGGLEGPCTCAWLLV